MTGRLKNNKPCYHYNNKGCQYSDEQCKFKHIYTGPCKVGALCNTFLCPYQHYRNQRRGDNHESSMKASAQQPRIDERRYSEGHSSHERNTQRMSEKHRLEHLESRPRAASSAPNYLRRSDHKNNFRSNMDGFFSNDLRAENSRAIGEKAPIVEATTSDISSESEVSDGCIILDEVGGSDSDCSEPKDFEKVIIQGKEPSSFKDLKDLNVTPAKTKPFLKQKLDLPPKTMEALSTSIPLATLENFQTNSGNESSLETCKVVLNNKRIVMANDDFEMLSNDSSPVEGSSSVIELENQDDIQLTKPNILAAESLHSIENNLTTQEEDFKDRNLETSSRKNNEDIAVDSGSLKDGSKITKKTYVSLSTETNLDTDSLQNFCSTEPYPAVNISSIHNLQNNSDPNNEGLCINNISEIKVTNRIETSSNKNKKIRPEKRFSIRRKCTICGDAKPRKSKSSFKHHVFSHYYTELEDKMFQVFGFEKPSTGEFICKNYTQEDCDLKTVQRDYISLLRHYAFKHNYLLKLTSCKPEYLEGEVCNDQPLPNEDPGQLDITQYKSKAFISDDETESEDELIAKRDVEQPITLSESKVEPIPQVEYQNDNEVFPFIEQRELNFEEDNGEKDIVVNNDNDEITEERQYSRSMKKEVESILMAKMEQDFEGT